MCALVDQLAHLRSRWQISGMVSNSGDTLSPRRLHWPCRGQEGFMWSWISHTSVGPVAQWIRHRPTEPGIAGSSPAGVIGLSQGALFRDFVAVLSRAIALRFMRRRPAPCRPTGRASGRLTSNPNPAPIPALRRPSWPHHGEIRDALNAKPAMHGTRAAPTRHPRGTDARHSWPHRGEISDAFKREAGNVRRPRGTDAAPARH